MSNPGHRNPTSPEQATVDDDPVTGLTRRTVLAAAATTTAAAAMRLDMPALAQVAETDPDMIAFENLSAALTGVAKAKLAPDTDPIDIKQEYFGWVKDNEPAAFTALLQIAKSTTFSPGTDGIIKQADVDKLVHAIEAKDDTKYLARSIVLMWYLGSWYKPADLMQLKGTQGFISHTVISPKAYTQGWLWRVAQAHPMGYSEMQFGYWTRDPNPITDFIAVRPQNKRGT
jgi:hypothetical protein